MTTLEDLKSKVDLLSVGMLKACDRVRNLSDITTLTFSRNTRAATVRINYNNFSSHLLYSDKRLMTLLDYLEESLQLSEIQSITYYIPSKKIVFTFNKNRIYLDPEEPLMELSNFSKGIKRKLPKTSIQLQLNLLELLFKDTVNSLSKSKLLATASTEDYSKTDSFKQMLESVNNVISFNRHYIERTRDTPVHNNRVWGPRHTYLNEEYAHPQVRNGEDLTLNIDVDSYYRNIVVQPDTDRGSDYSETLRSTAEAMNRTRDTMSDSDLIEALSGYNFTN